MMAVINCTERDTFEMRRHAGHGAKREYLSCNHYLVIIYEKRNKLLFLCSIVRILINYFLLYYV